MSYLAAIQAFAFNFAPPGWARCDGQLMPISQYTALFRLIGTTYGGNGQSSFALPDLRGRVMIHQGHNYAMGQAGGSETTALQVSNLPPHNHLLRAANARATSNVPNAGYLAAANGTDHTGEAVTVQVYGPTSDGASLNPATISPTGEGIPFSIVQPYLTINLCIALEDNLSSGPSASNAPAG